MSEEEPTAKAVEDALAKENPKGNKCVWCGDWHDGFCPRIKSVTFDPDTGKIVRYEFFEPKK